MEAAGHLVALAVELAAGVELVSTAWTAGMPLSLGSFMGSTGMPRPSSIDLAAPVGQQGDVDAVAVAGHGLVDRVVDDLVDQVVQAADTGGADVHAGALADVFEALEGGDRTGVVGVGGGGQGVAFQASRKGGRDGDPRRLPTAGKFRNTQVRSVIHDVASLPDGCDDARSPSAVGSRALHRPQIAAARTAGYRASDHPDLDGRDLIGAGRGPDPGQQLGLEEAQLGGPGRVGDGHDQGPLAQRHGAGRGCASVGPTISSQSANNDRVRCAVEAAPQLRTSRSSARHGCGSRGPAAAATAWAVSWHRLARSHRSGVGRRVAALAMPMGDRRSNAGSARSTGRDLAPSTWSTISGSAPSGRAAGRA